MWFMIGLIVGSWLGFAIAAMLRSMSESEDRNEEDIQS